MSVASPKSQMEANQLDGNSIIQCPRCQTKFSVEAELISQADEPRFHCSRCDNVFGIEIDLRLPLARPSEFSSAEKLSASEEVYDQHATSTSDFEPVILGADDMPIEKPETANPESSNLELEFEATEPSMDTRTDSEQPAPSPISQSRSSLSINIPRRFDPRLRSSAPQESAFEENHTQMELNFQSEQRWTGPSGYKRAMSARDIPEHAEFGPMGGATDGPIIMHSRQSSRVQLPRLRLRGWSGLFMITGTLGGFLAILVALALFVRFDAIGFDNWLATWMPGLRQVPPAELRIVDTKFQRITLSNGEIIPVISGQILNKSPELLREVHLEGLAFDRNGTLLARKRVSSASNLAKTRIPSLSSEMIQNLQNSNAGKGFNLKPGDREQFAVALLANDFAGIDLSQAGYYSARIYSVSNSSR